MNIENWPIDKPIGYARNPRKNAGAVDKVAASIKAFGFRQPIVVDTEGVVVVGHTRLLAAKKLGYTEVPVHVADNLTAAQIRAYRIADNRTNEEAEWDTEMLALEFEELQAQDFSLDLTAFDSKEISKLLGGVESGDVSGEPPPAASETIPEKFDVLVTCSGEQQQAEVLELLQAGGYQCRALIA